jgi:hypothetical protein
MILTPLLSPCVQLIVKRLSSGVGREAHPVKTPYVTSKKTSTRTLAAAMPSDHAAWQLGLVARQ